MKIIKTLLSVAVLSASTTSVWAAGTAADTPIDNMATISYSVSGTVQTDIESSETGNSTPGTGNGGNTTFRVDKKIDLTVTANAGPFSVVPSATGETITYQLKNEGNSTEFFLLEESQLGSGDDFDTSACTITTAPETITGTDTVQLIADATTTVTVACTIPPSTSVGDGDTSILDLKATAVTNTGGGTAYVESAADDADPLVVDVVLADGVGSATDTGAETVVSDPTGTRNASHSAVNTYTVGTATLEVTKTSSIISDPFNGTTNPKRIPGAVIEYTITVENTGSVAASALTVADHIPTNMTYVAASCSGGCTFNAALLIGATTAPGVSETGLTVAAAGTATVTFRATVD